jgi:predicted permease
VRILWQDLRFASRVLRKSIGFTIVSILTLGLGIAVTSSIVSLVDAVLVRPLPFPDADRIVFVHEKLAKQDQERRLATLADFLDWRDRNQVFEEMAAWTPSAYTLTSQGAAEELWGARVSVNLFHFFGVRPTIGRAFIAEDQEPGADQVVILSQKVWRRRYGGDAGLIGRQITIDGKSSTVVGILPADFSLFGTGPEYDVWVPLAFHRAQLARDNHIFAVFARLGPGVSINQARAEMDSIVRSLATEFPSKDPDVHASVVSMHEELAGSLRPALRLLLLAAAFVLGIGCVNVANLVLSRAMSRRREIAVRLSLGASPRRILQQLVTESMLLSLLGGTLGLVGTALALRVFLVLLPFTGGLGRIPFITQVRIDPAVVAFTLLASVLAGTVCGVIPALHIFDSDLHQALKEGAGGSRVSHRGRTFRRIVVISEVSLSLVSLLSAGLLMRSFSALANTNPGFDSQNVLTLRLRLPESKYPESSQISSFYERLDDAIRRLPNVRSAGMINLLPLSGWRANSEFEIQSGPAQRSGEKYYAEYRVIDSTYFRTMGIPLLAGRELVSGDGNGAPLVAVVNDTAARKFSLGEDILGRQLRFLFIAPTRGPWTPRLRLDWIRVVGVVADTTEWRLGEAKVATVYLPFLQHPSPLMSLVVRAPSDPLLQVPTIRSAISELDADQPVTDVKAMDQYRDAIISQPRLNAFIVGLFSTLATMLAAIGIYGVISYSVAQQTQEIGIRMALGAEPSDVVRLVLKQGMWLTLAGLVIGLMLGIAVLPRILSSLTYGITVHDPTALLGALALLACVAFAACYIPARRAATIDPLVAVRAE